MNYSSSHDRISIWAELYYINSLGDVNRREVSLNYFH